MPFYGLDPTRPLLSLVCAVGDREHALELAERWLVDTQVNGVVALRGDELMLVLDGLGFTDPPKVVASAKSLALLLALQAGSAGAP
jgi:hypothetical protein